MKRWTEIAESLLAWVLLFGWVALVLRVGRMR